MKFFAKLEKKTSIWYLLATLFGFFLLRLPSLFEPYWYGDEGIYEVIGNALRHGRLLYGGIWDNKPPLLYVMYAFFDGNQGGARFLSLLFGLVSVVIFYFLAKKLFTTEKIVSITTAIFALLLALPLLEGNIANAENFMILPILLAALYIVSTLQSKLTSPHPKLVLPFFLSGILLGIAFLYKIIAIFDLGTFALFAWIILYKSRHSFFASIYKVLPLFIGFFIPILTTIAYFALHGILGEFIHSTFSSNVGYVNYGNQFIIPQGLLLVKLLILGAFSFFVFMKRDRLSLTHIFVTLWLAFSLFNALFSQRPYTHYVLVLIGAVSLFVGIILTEKTIQKKLFALLLVLLLFVLTNFWINGKTLLYYGNFVGFITGTKSVQAYRSFFDNATPNDYDIATFFNRHKKPGDNLFVWGNDGQIYKLAGILPQTRFIVAYHITMTRSNTIEVVSILHKNPPRFIVILPGQPPLPFSLSGYSEIAILGQAVVYEKDY